MTDREAMQMALEVLESFKFAQNPLVPQSIYVLRKALAQPEQESVAWDGECVLGHCGSPDKCDRFGDCRAAPPSKPWVSLTSEELASIVVDHAGYPTRQLTAIEAALRSKNNG